MTDINQPNRIGILGGTFDPIHHGHLFIAQTALEECRLDTVIFVPVGAPPHKLNTGITPGRHRYNMVELAIEDHPQFEISDHEIKQPGTSYTINMLRYFNEQYPAAALHLILGADSLSDIQTWHQFESLFTLADMVVLNRQGAGKAQLAEQVRDLHDRYHASITLIESIRLDISSSLLRDLISRQRSVRYLTPEPVRRYMAANNLYHKAGDA
jgi:nicotinate-nucleotide adenylyltransferase